ncbi:HAD-like domain-containing protein [Dactylonectria macrodidyma]|uniref:HAD-like domain-containing protein n=1 Tax=Dactylonectria macrodidyma TaxID=307937 RepID=A0A9P9DBV2_9HYPO|nr:HAD-like domain-containing protein [Dactylonectria macrodidyma]
MPIRSSMTGRAYPYLPTLLSPNTPPCKRRCFPAHNPLRGVTELLADLGRANGVKDGSDNRRRVHVALATSSHEHNFKLKTDHLTDLFSVFPSYCRVLGDDPRLQPGRGKPLPDIFLLALETINDSLAMGEEPIKPEECLVFEDSVSGVEAGRRAGMRVVWVPHPGLKEEYDGREGEVLAGRTGEAGDVDLPHVGEVDDGWAYYMQDLMNFPYQDYGIMIPPVAVERESSM